MIIDAHAHIGYDYVFDEEVTEGDLILHNQRYGVDCSIVQPNTPRIYMDDTRAIHDRIYELTQKYPGRFFGMASINPHFRPEEYREELLRCIKSLRFVGVKISPIAHAAHPSGMDSMHVYEICREAGIPVMVHTGAGAPFADPAGMIKAVEAFRDVVFIMAHAGGDAMFQQALYIAQKYDNVYLEPSWINVLNLREAVKVLGPEKIMFSSDMPENIPVELAKYRYLFEGEPGILEQLLGKTAETVFKLKI